MSINRAQAEALAEGFLDSIGEDRTDFRARNTFTEVVLLAAELIEQAQKNLNRTNSNATGALSESLEASEPVAEGGTLSIDVFMNYYGQFVNKGVKGLKKGKSNAGYAFKYEYPSKKMVEAIQAWIDQGKLKTQNVNAQKTVSKQEKKNASIGEIASAYAVARSIIQKGIKPTGFMDKAIETTRAKVADRLGLALKVDITAALKG